MRALPVLVSLVLAAAVLPVAVAAQPAQERVPPLVAALTEGEHSRIVVVDSDGSTRVLTEGAFDVGPVAAPDGARAAFVRLAAEGEERGELGLLDLATGHVELTGVDVDRTVPLLWEGDEALISSTPEGIVRIRLNPRFVEFVHGTAAGQVALDVRSEPAGILAARGVVEDDRHVVQVLELYGDRAPAVLWSSSPESRATVATASYGPARTIAFVSTISSIGFGTVQYVHFLDPDGRSVSDAQYGGDGPVNLMSGPFWQPDGGAVLFGGSGTERFPGQETAPATLLVEGLGEDADRTVATRPKPRTLHALGWRPDGSAAIALTAAPDTDAALLVLDHDGHVLREVDLPGGFAVRLNMDRFGTPDADLLPPIRRSGGVSRIATATQVSQATFPGAVDVTVPLTRQVVLARSDVYADALAGAPLARHLAAPLLLTGPTGLDPITAAEIERLGVEEAVLLGGESALGPKVADDLQQLGVQSRRLWGTDRFATAAAISEELPEGDRVVLVEGAHADANRGWPDAVSAAPFAAAATAPLLLTTADTLPAATSRALRERAPGIVTVVGGTAAVSEDVAIAAAEAAGGTHERIAGPTRVATSVAVADAQIAAGTGSAASLWVATATNWPDALAAGPAVAADGGVLLLASDRPAGSELRGFLERTHSRTARLVGGPGVLGGAELQHLLLSAGLGGPDARPMDIP
jgi:putative cell wall-binding protein